MSDPTEYDPNSKDLTDDPNFLAPRCGVCGVPWANHMGIMGVCLWNKALKEDLKASLEAHDEMRLEIAQLRKERDEARRLACEYYTMEGSSSAGSEASCKHYSTIEAKTRGWDCFKKEETQQAMNNIAKLDEDLGL